MIWASSDNLFPMIDKQSRTDEVKPIDEHGSCMENK